MLLSQTDLRHMVARASTISERLGGDFLPDEGQNSAKVIQARLDEWCQAAARGNWQRFEERLALDGLDAVEARRVLGHVHLREHATLPDWTITLQEVTREIESISNEAQIIDTGCWRFLDPRTPCPFEEILAPFIVVAQRRYAHHAGSASQLLSEEVQLTLQRHLLQVLTSLSVDTLYAEFSNLRTQSASADSAHTAVSQTSTQLCYQQFIKQMYQGGLASLLREYSVLARLLATTCDFWVESNIEFIQRLASDWPLLQRTFGDVSEPVTAIDPALSDPHCGRRAVMALTFASGRRLVYKPKHVGMEKSYYRLLAWCNEQGATPAFKILNVLERPGYGWVEYVAHEPCQDQQAVQRYYQRVGMLLCLAYVLGAVNCSYEQIIAHGEHPILVDADLLMHAYPCPDHQAEGVHKQCSDWEQPAHSVLHTGLLTNWQMRLHAPGKGIDISGFGVNSAWHVSNQQAEQTKSQHIALKYGSLKIRECLNISLCNGIQTGLEAQRAEVIMGFQRLYRLLLEQRASLLVPGSPLYAFQQQTARVPYRPGWAYSVILPRLLAPENLRDGAERGILLEWSGQGDAIPVEYKLWRDGNNTRWWPLLAAERQALARGDLPFFTTLTDSDTIGVDAAQRIERCFHQPGFALTLARLVALNDEDMSRQTGYIERVLRTPDEVMQGARRSNAEVDGDQDAIAMPMAAALEARALQIAEDLSRQAINMGDGSAIWLLPRFLMRSQHYQVQPMRYSLFDGACGVALFLAATARVSGEASYRKLALAALQPLRQALHSNSELVAGEMGIGGAVGLGSVVYAFTRISQFLDEPSLLADAKRAARLITDERIADDKALDVIAGSAGTILGLVAFYELSHDQEILERAVRCGQHLLHTRTMSKAGYLAWPTLGGNHITGFSHGAAGIIYALVRLHTATRNIDLLAAAREGLAYENCAFLPKIGNWADELVEGEPSVMATWCHGAPGIGLARLGGLPGLDTARIREDIEVALRTTQRVGARGADHLCCGSLGRADFLFTAAQRLARPELAATAQRDAWGVLMRAQHRGLFNLNNDLSSWVPIPNFFHGTSGIGYELLRMAQPCVVHSALLWE